MSHPFGDLLGQYLHRKRGLSQFKLANGIDQKPSVISEMCQGKRLTGSQARTRVVEIIQWLQQHDALYSPEEANDLLNAAGLSPLSSTVPVESSLLARLSQAGKSGSKPHVEVESPAAIQQHNLPEQLTRFFGRSDQIEELIQLIKNRRLVTLTGSGGVGKTRLAIQVARRQIPKNPDGVWLVELAPVSDPELVATTLASALGVREEPNRPILDTLVCFLAGQKLLLVLDNCEHVLEACARTVDLILRKASEIRILATSREALGITGEFIFRVPSLTVPAPEQNLSLETLINYEAVQLFQERAVSADFTIQPQNAMAVAAICRRLDGIPLALELAAARVRMLTPEQIADRLDDAFHLLTGGSRTALPRQQTLRATIDWSYQLLSVGEQVLLRRLAVFAGGWTLEEAEQVCSDSLDMDPSTAATGEPASAGGFLPLPAILDLLSSLFNKSIVIAQPGQKSAMRYHMLETVRQYALEKLVEAGEIQVLAQKHSRYFMEFAFLADFEMMTAGRPEWMLRFRDELDNLRSALQWCYSDQRDIETGLRIATVVANGFFKAVGLYWEARQWLLTGITSWKPSFSKLDLAWALLILSNLDLVYSITVQDLEWLEKSVELFREIGPGQHNGLADALMDLAHLQIFLSEDWGLESARKLAEESYSITIHQEPNNTMRLAITACGLAEIYLHSRMNNFPLIHELAGQSHRLSVQTGDIVPIGRSLWLLAEIAEAEGDFERALKILDEALHLYVEGDDIEGTKLTHRNYGRAFRHQGDLLSAFLHDQEYLKTCNMIRIMPRIGDGLCRVGIDLTLHSRGNFDGDNSPLLLQAVRLFGAAIKITESSTIDTIPADLDDYRNALEILHAQLELDVFEQCWAEGQAMGMDEAVRIALDLNLAGR